MPAPVLNDSDPSNHIRRPSARPFLSHRVISAFVKWVTPQQAANPQVGASQSAVLLDCLKCVLRAGWRESARRWENRRDKQLISTYEKNQNSFHFFPILCRKVLNSSSKSL